MNRRVYESLRDHARPAFEGVPVLFAYLFGSMATGRDRPDSDVDVAVYLNAAPSADALDVSLSLADRLSNVAERGDVEVVVLNRAPLPVRARAIKEGVVFYSVDEPRRVMFESRNLREFFDFEFHARPLDRKFLDDIAKGAR
jgi:uncharacterized protein